MKEKNLKQKMKSVGKININNNDLTNSENEINNNIVSQTCLNNSIKEIKEKDIKLQNLNEKENIKKDGKLSNSNNSLELKCNESINDENKQL